MVNGSSSIGRRPPNECSSTSATFLLALRLDLHVVGSGDVILCELAVRAIAQVFGKSRKNRPFESPDRRPRHDQASPESHA